MQILCISALVVLFLGGHGAEAQAFLLTWGCAPSWLRHSDLNSVTHTHLGMDLGASFSLPLHLHQRDESGFLPRLHAAEVWSPETLNTWRIHKVSQPTASAAEPRHSRSFSCSFGSFPLSARKVSYDMENVSSNMFLMCPSQDPMSFTLQ